MLREWSDRPPEPEDPDRVRRDERRVILFACLFGALFLLGIWSALAG